MTVGVAVVDCSHHYAKWRSALLCELAALGPNVLWPAAGGFGAIGAPCMAASPVAHAIDSSFYTQIQSVLRDAVLARGGTAAIKTAHARIFDDRFGIRPKDGWITYDGKKMFAAVVPGESAHRDYSAVDQDTMTFGGFVNLGPRDQFFTCVPGSGFGFRDNSMDKKGFARMSTSETISMRARMKVYRVPPGYAITFDSTNVHCVTGTKKTPKPPADAKVAAKTQVEEGNLRKYVSWWMTVSDKTGIVTPDRALDRTEKLAAGRPPLLPSRQTQLFVPGNWSLHPERQSAFEAQFGGKYAGRVPTADVLKNYPEEWRAVYEVARTGV